MSWSILENFEGSMKEVLERFDLILKRELRSFMTQRSAEEAAKLIVTLEGITSISPIDLTTPGFVKGYVEAIESRELLSAFLCRVLVNFKLTIGSQTYAELIREMAKALHISGDHRFSSAPPRWRADDPHTIVGESVRFRLDTLRRRIERQLSSRETFEMWLSNNEHIVVAVLIQATYQPIQPVQFVEEQE